MISKMSFDEYKKIDAQNGSDLKHFMRSPSHYREHKLNPKPPTSAMAFGSLVHTMVLESELAHEQYFCMDESEILPLCVKTDGTDTENPRNTKVYKSWKKRLFADNNGKILVTQDDWNAAVHIRKAIQAHPKASALLAQNGQAEMSMQWTHPTGVFMKGRTDYTIHDYHADYGLVVDLKITTDARPSAFSRDIWKYRYDISMANYCEGLEIITGKPYRAKFIVVESEAPYIAMLYDLDNDVLEYAKSEIDRQCRKFLQCQNTGVWGGYEGNIDVIGLPPYADPTEVT